MRYKGYELDPFQEKAIEAIDHKHTVIVAAPTGAGKTLIAEYAIERYLQEGRRIIYTAPIKALSNQKFRDFSAAYGDRIGILTGDVVINPLAPVLIMTTEIFRNTLFDDPTRLAEVEYVILDEIHYINDIERGTVWEESILFAPPHINFLCLSATISNLEEFAAWMRSVRPQNTVEVICETQRPVPLEHHLYILGYGIGTLEDLRRLRRGEEPEGIIPAKDLLRWLAKEGRLPCLYFCFSRRLCEEQAEFYAQWQFLHRSQRREILALFDELAERFYVTHEPSAQRMRKLVARGVAYHHAGMLPTLKEVVERLFTSGLLQVLFTTETFAVGVNMPACTVVFDSLEKYDGVERRYLKAMEYHQMAGRAGRRGIDPVGYVYAIVHPHLAEPRRIARILKGPVEPVASQFNLSYSSILNLYQRYGLGLYQVCERSLFRYQSLKRLQGLERKQKEMEAKPPPPIECIYQRPELIYEYEQLQKEQEERRAEEQRLQKERRRKRGAKSQRRLESLLQGLQSLLRRLEDDLERSPCHHCFKQRECLRRMLALRSHAARQAELRKERERLLSYHRIQIERRLQILREFGYLDEEGLTVKGKVAAELHGFEVPLTELLFAGLFHEGQESHLNALVVALCYEAKPSQGYAPPAPPLRRFLLRAEAILQPLLRRERQLHIEDPSPSLTPVLSAAMEAWSEGAEFAKVLWLADADEGDVVRAFRHTIDLLRQLRRAVAGDVELQDKLSRCIARINRDVVDAERQLRAGGSHPPGIQEDSEGEGESQRALTAEP